MLDDDPLYLDVENWPIRIAEALDMAAEMKGNTVIYITAELPQEGPKDDHGREHKDPRRRLRQ